MLGYDWNPVSAEQKEAAMTAITGEVLWTNSLGGKVYHTHEDCQALNRTEELVVGSVEEAIAANRTRLCAFCARRDSITGVVTDNAVEVQEAVENPDYILRDEDPRMAVVLKEYKAENEERYRVIVKLAANDPKHPKNSIITAFYISRKKWDKYLRNKEILYIRPGI